MVDVDTLPASENGKEERRFLIVGIGASAGGLEALQGFFAGMPADAGFAFVVVTHQSPSHTSLLPEILARSTGMTVLEAAEGIRVEPNHVYVSPPGSDLAIAEGVIHLSAPPVKSLHFPVDHFFRSLSFDQKEQAVGIVLSGTGSDGTLGVRAIKDGFGMVMVQNEPSARYSGMPSSALATGLADYVLAPSEMPKELIRYAEGLMTPQTAIPPSVGAEPIQEILLLLRDKTGNDLSCYKMNTIHRRIIRRMNVLHVHDPSQYVRYLREDPSESDRLFAELLISVTRFFRDPEAFKSLAEALADPIGSLRDEQPFRVWVPGCATGEEAYSVAMVLVESMEKMQKHPKIQIFATDLDADAIETARQGVYSEGIATDVSQDRLERFFVKDGSLYRFRRDLREMLIFAPQNLIKDPPFTNMDLIVCRNLLIYLNAEIQRWVCQLFHHSLKPEGLLLLGSSETVGSCKDLFTTLDAKWKIYRRHETGENALPVPARPTGLVRIGVKGAEARALAGAREGRQAAQIQNLLLSRFAPCSLVVDEHGTIVYIHGRTGLYLELSEGRPRTSIVDMAREGLKQALRGSLGRAVNEKTEIVRDPVRVKTNGAHTDTILTVTPIQEPESLRGLLLVTLRPAPAAPETPQTAAGESRDERTETLERDLRYAQESLQSTIDDLQTANEELRASNEEMQSTNEELQSTNEELETSKEELQSLNEELLTVNTELEIKVAELARTTDDMQNLFNSTNLATVFLDERLNVKRFTEDARNIFRLVPSDVGRPLSDLASNLRYEALMQDCHDVLKTLAPTERHVATMDGRRYLMRILPYRTAENAVSGVVITFIDIESLKRAEVSRDFYESIVQTIREPLIVLDEALKVRAANKAFFEMFRSAPEDTTDRLIYDLGNRQWDIPALRKLLEEILPLSVGLTDYRVDNEFPQIGRRSFLLNAHRLERNPGEPGMILLAFKDITGES